MSSEPDQIPVPVPCGSILMIETLPDGQERAGVTPPDASQLVIQKVRPDSTEPYDQIIVCLPLDSALFPHPLAEEKFTDALQRSLRDSYYPEASIRIEWDSYVSLTQVQAKVADPNFNPDDVTDRVWYLKDLWRLVWEAVAGPLDQAGQKACSRQ